MQVFVPILVLVIALVMSYFIFIKGEIATSMSMFWNWSELGPKLKKYGFKAWLQIRKLRHVRKIIDLPLRGAYHNSSRDLPFAIGQVWIGGGEKIHIIGKMHDGNFILEAAPSVLGFYSVYDMRDKVYANRMYLYEHDTHEGLIPRIRQIGNQAGIIWEPLSM